MSNFQLSFLVFLQILQFQIADFLQSVYLCSPLYIHKSFLYTCFLKRSDYIEQNKIKISYRKNESWIILSQIEQSIKSKIESIGIPLKDWDISINYGIKTGYNDAFIIDTKKREEILNNCQTTNERTRTDELIRPILRGKDIRRYSYEFADKYLITTYNEYTDSNGIKHPSININDYPAVKKHLDCYWNEINKRQDKGDTPYNLRRCAYMDDFNKQKIVWADIATEPNFVQIDERIYFNNTCYMMVGAPNWFVDYLNSDLVKWYFPLTATDLGEKGTRYFKQFVEKIPIPTAFIGNIQSFFKLTDDEMNCISSSVNFNS
ncbi:TaqI-like C-terminal specificity domain-containing protein [Streptococcus mutans]|uniref:TaqI-like C-terminal specificity domain-containing protein n=1 Tax=Streptococcus mutans TaxID=1309 RepID=UPI00124ADA80